MALREGPRTYALTALTRIDESNWSDTDGDVNRQEIFELLRNERRRCALYYLTRRGDGLVPLSDIVDYVAAWQYDKPVGHVPADERMRVYSALHQTHLPKLDRANLIDYDQQRNEVRLRKEAEYARLYLEYNPGQDIAWSRYYGVLTVLGAALLGAHTVGVYPFVEVPTTVVALIVILMLGVSAVFQEYHDRTYRISASELYETESVQ